MKDNFLKENIAFIRDRKRLTYKEFAERIHVTEGQAKSYELRGSTPPVTTLLEIADFAQVTLDSLIRKKLTEDSFGLKNPKEYSELSSIYKRLADRVSSIELPLTPPLTPKPKLVIK